MKTIVYVPGISRVDKEKKVAVYAQKMVTALELNMPTKNSYEVVTSRITLKGYAKDVNMADIILKGKGNEAKDSIEYRIYEFSYADDFGSDLQKLSVFRSSLKLFGIFKTFFLKNIFISFKKNGLSGKAKFQSIFFFILLFGLGLNTLFLFPAIITTINEDIKIIPDIFKPLGKKFFDLRYMISYQHFKLLSKYFIAVTTALYILRPQVKNSLNFLSSEFVAFHYYFKYGEGCQDATGSLSLLIDKIVENAEQETKIELHAYSFGSALAIDVLFPQGSKNIDKGIDENIETFVTIGCFFDFLRVYYNSYTTDRSQAPKNLKKWFNINSKLDVLSSNFRDDDENSEAIQKYVPGNFNVINIPYEITNPDSISISDYIVLIGFKLHNSYWGTDKNTKSFFSNLFNNEEYKNLK
jgi:hypothetical protein